MLTVVEEGWVCIMVYEEFSDSEMPFNFLKFPLFLLLESWIGSLDLEDVCLGKPHEGRPSFEVTDVGVGFLL